MNEPEDPADERAIARARRLERAARAASDEVDGPGRPTASRHLGAVEDAIEFALARAEFASRSANVAAAERMVAIAETIALAQRHPELFLAGLGTDRREDVEFAVRAAVADLAVRLSETESTVRRWAHEAGLLSTRLPRLWAAFLEGEVPAANARIAAEVVASIPADGADPGVWAALDARLGAFASASSPRFRQRARAARERLHPEPAARRHGRAAEERTVFVDPAEDGMAWLTLLLSAPDAFAAHARLESDARALRDVEGEARTLAQLRADVAVDLLLADEPRLAGRPRARIAVTVPVLTLLGLSEEPGTLDGYGPIDADTARRLAAGAPSFTRILTHPVSGTALDVDRATYRVPADLRRWIGVRDQTCSFPGCGRRAEACDLDHLDAWAAGGVTAAANLHPVCRHHHRLKHRTGWTARRAVADPVRKEGEVVWRSPTGHLAAAGRPEGMAVTRGSPPLDPPF